MLADPLLTGDRREAEAQARSPFGFGGLFGGVMPATVTSLEDPDGQGRVRIALSAVPDPDNAECELWARVATLYAGKDRGTWFMPEVGDEVLVAFEQNDPRRPYVLGGLWNGVDTPAQSGSDANTIKQIKSRNGVVITIADERGQESLTLETPAGQTITLKDGPGQIEIADSNGNTVKLEASGISIEAAARLSISAAQVSVSASMVSVDAGMSNFSGVVRADTVICNSIVAASYSPGAGNIW
ncbi:phage baseplate assembly protein V [Erythrobacter oryzae]|uniref:phage baseplate assembly protein V n=1 Tax=Erythrobacter oryzae TaxID=3019556 RepID=UPI0025538CBB|nr:phage baseplate assembly protein V [Erythrobacter sp. COR-2]